MKEIVVLMASALPTERIFEMLEEAMAEYKEVQLLNNEEQIERTKQHVILISHMLTIHFMNEGKGVSGAVDTLKQMQDIEKATNLFKTTKN